MLVDFIFCMMLARQAIEAQRFFDVLFYLSAKPAVAPTPLSEPSCQIPSSFRRIPPVVNLAQLLQAIIVRLTRKISQGIAQEMNMTSLQTASGSTS